MRSRIDYFVFYIKYHQSECIITAVNIILLIISIFNSSMENIFSESTNQSSKILIILGFLFNSIWSLFVLMRDIFENNSKDHKIIDSELIIDHSINVSDIEKNKFGFKLISICHDSSNNYYALYSEEINSILINSENINLSFQKRKTKEKQIYLFIKENKDILFRFLKCNLKSSLAEEKYFFNERKLCLTDDLFYNVILKWC